MLITDKEVVHLLITYYNEIENYISLWKLGIWTVFTEKSNKFRFD